MKYLLATLLLCATRLWAADPVALRHAHAHNDYEHVRPLEDALAAGFTSVEADLYLIEGEIRVAHNRSDAKPGRTLRSLYLEPLQKIAGRQDGRIHPNRPEFYLMLDYKASGEPDVMALHLAVTQELSEFKELLTTVQDGCLTRRAVTIVLSGSRPAEVIAREPLRRWAIDGQMADLTNSAPAHLIPWISTSWRSTFSWNGEGEFPPDQRNRLKALVAEVHQHGRQLRFWGAPDQPDFWRTLRSEGVDLINTDKLQALADYLTQSSDP